MNNNSYEEKYFSILSRVKKPSRYIGKEWNTPSFEDKKGSLKVLLAFPDTYEIGMSHLGLRLLYYLINKDANLSAERVFAPARDFSGILRQERIPLRSLETKTPLRKFDIIGFSLQYELSYTNVLNILDLGEIPIRSDLRTEDDPIIIAGGPCAFNPEPIAMFIDAFVIGDGENITKELCYKVIENREKGFSRTEIIRSLSEIEGVYVPVLYDVERDVRSDLLFVKQGSAPYPVKRRVEFNLDNIEYPDSFPVPYSEIVHDRVNIEISRGCNSGCRFCQAGVIYKPNRPRDPNKLFDTIKCTLDKTGLDEVSLLSLDVSSYPQLEKFIGCVMNVFMEDKISLSLPSLRSDAISEKLAGDIKSVKKTGFTIAPEAGNQRMRDIINKGITEQDILDSVGFAYSQGWQLVKLYFMIGLPNETDEDVYSIFDLAKKVSRTGKQISPSSGNINLSVSTFVPKPHTPFQWYPMDTSDEVRRKQSLLFDVVKKYRSIKLKWHDSKSSYLEAIIARGDRDVGRVIERAFQNGALFDAWTDELRFDIWQQAFESENIHADKYIYQKIPLDSQLPWSHIDTGVSVGFLKSELKKSEAQALTTACSKSLCHNCGVCTPEYFTAKTELFIEPEKKNIQIVRESKILERTVFFSYLGYYTKINELKFLSNRELLNAITRAFRRARIPIHHSYGYSPHPRFSFGPALSVGMQGLREPLRFEILEDIEPKRLEEMLNNQLPAEIRIFDISKIPNNVNTMNNICAYGMYSLEYNFNNDIDNIKTSIENIMNTETLLFKKGDDFKEKDLRPGIIKMSIDDNKLTVLLQTGTRPQDVFESVFGNPVPVDKITRLGFCQSPESP